MVALASSLIPARIQLIKFTSASDWQSLECVQARPKTFQQYDRSHKNSYIYIRDIMLKRDQRNNINDSWGMQVNCGSVGI